MRLRFLPALFLCAFLTAQVQSMTVGRLMEWLRNPATAKENDSELASFLSKVKLTERLDDKTLDSLRGVVIFGPKTMDALHRLRDQSKSLQEPNAASVLPQPLPPVPNAEEQASIIDDARRYAIDYSEKLPNFFCYEREQRWAAPARTAAEPNWQTQDTIVKRVTYYGQKEDEKVLQHNNTYTTVDMKSLGGSQSIGDFGSMLRQVFDPQTAAIFEWRGWSRADKQLFMTFDFRVPLERSQYRLEVEDHSIRTAYRGWVLLEARNHAVLRISVEAVNIPADFPLRSASDTVDYALEKIADQSYLLPVEADIYMGTVDTMTKNVKRFMSYRKYEVTDGITFDEKDLPPLPTDPAQEKKPEPPPAKKGGG
jgi:hypothetical protein